MSDVGRSENYESYRRSSDRRNRRSRSQERSHRSHRDRSSKSRRRSYSPHERRRRSSHHRRNHSPESPEPDEKEDKSKPNLELSGKLAAESNLTVEGVVLKFTEPPESKLPDIRWRTYIFKNDEMIGEPIPVHQKSCYLFGRDRSVCDIPTDHPSCSKQHCVLQYRCMKEENADGSVKEVVKPYLLDLESINGTFINKEKIEPSRYYEIIEQDTVRIGMSSRDYVFLHEESTA